MQDVGLSPIEQFSAWMLRKDEKPWLHLQSKLLKFSADQTGTLDDAKLKFFGTEDSTTPSATLDAQRVTTRFTGNPPKPTAGPMTAEEAVVHYTIPKDPGRGSFIFQIPLIDMEIVESAGETTIRSFYSDKPFTMKGPGMSGSGTGVDGNRDEGSIRVRKDPFIELQPGSLNSLRGRMVVRSRGHADIITKLDWLRESTATLHKECVFRFDDNDGRRFLETSSDKLNAFFLNVTRPGKTSDGVRIKTFEASENVTFRTDLLEGTAASLSGAIEDDGSVSRIDLRGNYRIDLRTKGARRRLPGLGSPETVYLTGSSVATGRPLGDPGASANSMEITATGAPVIAFLDATGATIGSIRGDTIIITVRDNVPASLKAFGHVSIQGATGVVRGDSLSFEETGGISTLTIRADDLVEAVFQRPPAAGLNAPQGGGSGTLHAKVLQFTDAGGQRSHLTGAGSVRGKFLSKKGKDLTFRSSRLETDIEDGKLFNTVLSDNVSALVPSPGYQLYGSELSLPSLESDNPGGELSGFKGTLRGTPARLEGLPGGPAADRGIVAFDIVFSNGQLDATGSVEVSFPAAALGGPALSKHSVQENTSKKLVWLSGTALRVLLDEAGRQTSALLTGPVRSRGSVNITGSELTLDFIQGIHSLKAIEGGRVCIEAPPFAGEAGYKIEGPRVDFDNSSEVLSVLGNSKVTIFGTSFDIGAFAPKDPLAGPQSSIIEIVSASRATLAALSVHFEKDVRATATRPDGSVQWELQSAELSVLFDKNRQPVSAQAVQDVTFSFENRLSGRCDELLADQSSQTLELRCTPPRNADLSFGNLRFRGEWLRFNTRTCLVETGTARFTTDKPADSATSRPR